jgi:hypothetical protein
MRASNQGYRALPCPEEKASVAGSAGAGGQSDMKAAVEPTVFS